MGLCLCKRNSEDGNPEPEQSTMISTVFDGQQILNMQRNDHKHQETSTAVLEVLIKETLKEIPLLIGNDQEPPAAMTKLHKIAENDAGWLAVVQATIRAIPSNNPHGPAVISLLIDDCPLPTTETVCRVAEVFPIYDSSASFTLCQHRNFCILLGCLAEKLPGPTSVALLSKSTLNYLINNLDPTTNPSVILFSIIALEKFAMTSENQAIINNVLLSLPSHPISNLEPWGSSSNFLHKQIAFCAQWVMDNIFLQEGRMFTYERVNKVNINAMLNTKDVSEYLKISPDGLTARCDASSFESVRCTFQVNEGIYYYEVTLITSGVMQIGWATKNSKFLNYEGYGIGDDEFSLSYDGCRKMIWFNANCEPQNHPEWKCGDILGCLINLQNYSIRFYLNGSSLPPCHQLFRHVKSGFFAAASFMSFQQCEFNFGHKPFKHPPLEYKFKSFNSSATLDEEEKLILPKHIQMKIVRDIKIKEDSCTLCYDGVPNIFLLPCQHTGFCQNCALLLEVCPMCRATIKSHQVMT